MLRMLRRAARLLVAGALGVALSPAAYLAAQDVRSPASVQITSSQMKLEAMKVEMALLADYATYNLPLTVRVEDDCLSLHGQVNDEHSRLHALRVARQSCYLPVKDAMQGPTPRAPIQSAHLDSMRRTVCDVIERSLGDRLNDLDVRLSAEGQVTLHGQVATVEDKLAASKALRGLPGCHSVVNCLAVETHRQAGHTITLVTRDGKHAVHGTVAPGEAPTATAKKAASRDSAADSELLSPPRVRSTTHAPLPLPAPPSTNLPSTLPPARDVYVRLKSANQVAPITYVAPTSAAPTPAPVQSPISFPATSPTAAPAPAAAPAQVPMQAFVVVPYPNNGAVGAVQYAAAPARATSAPKPPVTMFGRVFNAFGSADKQTPPPPVQAQTPAAAPSAAVAYYTRGTTAQPTQPVQEPPLAPAPQPQPAYGLSEKDWPPAYNGGESRGPRPALTNSPAIRLAARPELATRMATEAPPAPQPAPKQGPPPAQKPAPKPVATVPVPVTPVVAQLPSPPAQTAVTYQTLSKVVSPVKPKVEAPVVVPTPPKLEPVAAPVFHEPVPASSPVRAASAQDPMDSPTYALKVVKMACGKLARSVHVETGADGKPFVHVHALPASEKEIIGKLMAVPEIAQSSLRLQIHLPE